jgi:hypothetical protein
LRFNIPHTIGLFREKFYLYSENGHLVYTENFKEEFFLEKIEQYALGMRKYNLLEHNPSLIIKSEGYPTYNTEKVRFTLSLT